MLMHSKILSYARARVDGLVYSVW